VEKGMVREKCHAQEHKTTTSAIAARVAEIEPTLARAWAFLIV